MTTSSPWLNEQKLREEILDPDGNQRKLKIESLDIAGLYHYNDPDQDKLFDALAATSRFEYF